MDFAHRRARLLQSLVPSGRPALLAAGGAISRNYPANVYPYRADSSFLYFFANPEPGSLALLDPQSGRTTLFLPERTIDDALWHGPVPSFDEVRAASGVDEVLDVERLETHVTRLAAGRPVDSIAVADHRANRRLRAVTGQLLDYDDPVHVGAPRLIEAIGELRLRKDDHEIAVMRATAVVTREAHESAMRGSRPGVTEELLAGLVEGTFARAGCTAAYGTILSVRGEVLHNHAHTHTLKSGDLVLLDAGAEQIQSGYCSDVTRCWPANGRFNLEQREIYDIVLAANEAAIAAARPGARYRDVHRESARVIAEGLVSLGVLRGNADALVESGAHALFFPHGVGHPIGLDVHDLEAFGDPVLYKGRERSAQFGTKYLRWDRDLEPGMTFTIEPGIYFVPAILHSPALREEFNGQVDWTKAERYLAMNDGRGFGGIRIEDDVLCTEGGTEVLTRGIPKQPEAIEALVGLG